MRRFRASALVLLLGMVLHPGVGLACVPEEGRMPCCDEQTEGCHPAADELRCCADAPSSSENPPATTAVGRSVGRGDTAVLMPAPAPFALDVREVSIAIAPHRICFVGSSPPLLPPLRL
jgi:hypothetical protein